MLKLEFIETELPAEAVRAAVAAGGHAKRLVARLPDESTPGGRQLPHGWVRVVMLRRPAGSSKVWEMSISHCKALGNNPADRPPDDDEVAPCLALVKRVKWSEISPPGAMVRRFMGR